MDYSTLEDGLPQIAGYEFKWEPNSPYTEIGFGPTRAPAPVQEEMIGWSTALSERLRCRDYQRFDWRMRADGTPCLLEANPNPGWNRMSSLPRAALMADIEYPAFLRMILDAAEERMAI
jgi:D-alanine-D-alanine ligase